MQDFMDEYTCGQYFNHITGIIEYFQEDSVFNDSEWAKRSDAAVLLAIQDGQRALQGATSMGDYTEFIDATGKDSPVPWWKAFQERVSDHKPDLALWGIAEQLGVDFGTFIADPVLKDPDAKETIFAETYKGHGDLYRMIVSSGAPNIFAPENCTLGVLCRALTSPSFFIHPSHSGRFVKWFSQTVVSQQAERAWVNRHVRFKDWPQIYQ